MSMEGLSHLVSTVRRRGTESTTTTNRTADALARDSEAATADDEGFKEAATTNTRASEAVTAKGDGFRGSDDRRRGLQMQRRLTARALKAAMAEDTTAGRHHKNSTPNHQSRDDGENRS
ncbi:hypothetical protein Scep_029733 [Stephania cephalantha]|uniref:Uncharacterized protein n=1 Tax=Stephania cephalantha TaxID=152367 RepID=A0AAP0HFX2_9MAGN